jgi:hypothetical protein
MSYKSSNNKKVVAKKPFCKVCHDAGKTEAEYTSHFVRSLPDFNGNTKVTCPILAATECRYCYNLGHTTKFCPILEENNKRSKKEKSVAIQAHKSEQRAASRTVSEPVVERKYLGTFAALGDDSDEEKPVPQQVVEVQVDHFPALFGSKKEVTSVAKAVSWAAIAERPAVPVLKPIVKPVIKNTPQIAGKKWADYSDSDSEEEEEDFGAPLVRTNSVYNNLPCYARASADDEDW